MGRWPELFRTSLISRTVAWVYLAREGILGSRRRFTGFNGPRAWQIRAARLLLVAVAMFVLSTLDSASGTDPRLLPEGSTPLSILDLVSLQIPAPSWVEVFWIRLAGFADTLDRRAFAL